MDPYTSMIKVRFTDAATSLIKSFFAQYRVLVGKPTYKTASTGKVVVQIPYFLPVGTITEAKINALGIAITRLFNSSAKQSPATVEVRLIRLQYPYLDSSILAQYVALNAGKYNFTRMQKMIFRKVPTIKMDTELPTDALPSQLTGVKLELAGRLTTQRSIPRKTVENGHTGSFTASNKLNTSLDFSQYASKNKLNAFTIKV